MSLVNLGFLQRLADAAYEEFIRFNVIYGNLELPHQNTIKVIVGHDPQKLLSHEHFLVDGVCKGCGVRLMRTCADLWGAETLREVLTKGYAEWAEKFRSMVYGDFIDFEADSLKAGKSRIPTLFPGEHAVVFDRTGFRRVPLSAIIRETDEEIVIDVSEYHYGGEIPGFLQTDYSHLERRYFAVDRKSLPEKPTKPNGRSLDYLKHDKSKRNRRRK